MGRPKLKSKRKEILSVGDNANLNLGTNGNEIAPKSTKVGQNQRNKTNHKKTMDHKKAVEKHHKKKLANNN